MSPGSRRLKKGYRKSASNLHKAVGDILLNHIAFKFTKVYQEYPVNRINNTFQSGREKFDWVVLDPYRAIIECHGIQHFEPVRFGGITQDEAEQRFKEQQYRDQIKQKAAEEAGYKYIIVKYYEEPTSQLILQRIQNHEPIYKPVDKVISEAPKRSIYTRVRKKYKKWFKESGREQEFKNKQREYRRKRYEQAKNYKSNKKSS